MHKPIGRRDLSLIRESGSTARVINLGLIYERFGQEPEHAAQPMFANKRLNRALILKHTLRPDEREYFQRPPITATKIVLPFASSDLRLGGASLMVAQIGFDRSMTQGVGGYDDHAALEADIEMLQLLDALPSFDPFLMRERLRASGRMPARCYFDVSEADVARMRTFVGNEILQLVDLAFANGGAAGRDLSTKLADKLMTDETAQSLDPLRLTLRMNGEEYREGVFAWKGFLYYKWMISDSAGQLAALTPAIAGLRVLRASKEEAGALTTIKHQIIEHLGVAQRRVEEALLAYDCAFASLASGDVGAFRDFLLKAPSLFLPIGEAVGVLKHVESFWRFRFPGRVRAAMDVDEAFEILQDLELTLGGVELVRRAPQGASLAA
ncbi:MAG: hypothetical protein AB7T08_15040 [Hyphomonadaceae bacterium]